MSTPPTVRVDNNLTASQPSITLATGVRVQGQRSQNLVKCVDLRPYLPLTCVPHTSQLYMHTLSSQMSSLHNPILSITWPAHTTHKHTHACMHACTHTQTRTTWTRMHAQTHTTHVFLTQTTHTPIIPLPSPPLSLTCGPPITNLPDGCRWYTVWSSR